MGSRKSLKTETRHRRNVFHDSARMTWALAQYGCFGGLIPRTPKNIWTRAGRRWVCVLQLIFHTPALVSFGRRPLIGGPNTHQRIGGAPRFMALTDGCPG